MFGQIHELSEHKDSLQEGAWISARRKCRTELSDSILLVAPFRRASNFWSSASALIPGSIAVGTCGFFHDSQRGGMRMMIILYSFQAFCTIPENLKSNPCLQVCLQLCVAMSRCLAAERKAGTPVSGNSATAEFRNLLCAGREAFTCPVA